MVLSRKVYYECSIKYKSVVLSTEHILNITYPVDVDYSRNIHAYGCCSEGMW